MRVKYSCVVDTQEKFKKQGRIWLNSLIGLGGVDPADIWVHCVRGMEPEYIKACADTGANVELIGRFGDGKYCNKIRQVRSAGLWDADAVILMDTDMIMLENFEHLLDLSGVSGKIVDLANPPIGVLDAVFALAGLEKSLPDRQIECAPDLSYGANFNGGLYIIPRRYFELIAAGWQKWALWLLEHGKPLYDAGKQAHIDQVSFCMTAHEHKLGVRYLERAYNYPLPYDFGGREPMPFVLHYHDRTDGSFMLSPDYEPAGNIKEAVRKANAFIAQIK